MSVGMASERSLAEVIEVKIEQGRTGLLYGTSDDLPGLLAAAPDLESLMTEIPACIQALYAAQEATVEVKQARRRVSSVTGRMTHAWIAIPGDGR